MKKNSKEIFEALRPPAPPAYLEQRILSAVLRHERRVLYAKMTGFALALVASASVLALRGVAFGHELSDSGFLSLVSLFFSVFSSAAGDIRDLGLSIVESFPIFSAAIVLASFTVFLSSLAAIFDEARYLGSHRSLAKG